MTPRMALLVLVLLVGTIPLTPLPAFPTDGGITFAWNTPLDRLAENIAGPTLRSLLIIGVVFVAFILWTGGWEAGGKRILAFVVAAAIAVTAVTFIGQLGLSATLA